MTIYNTVYKTTNSINGKIYVGVHITDEPMDKYIGSGTNLKPDIKLYGKQNFDKEILFYAFTKDDAYWAEEQIVNKEFVLREDTYNKYPGGSNPPNTKGLKRTKEWRENISKALTGKIGHPCSNEKKLKQKIKWTAECNPNYGKLSHNHDHTIYEFKHPEYGIFKGTRGDFSKLTNILVGDIGRLIKGKYKSLHKWTIPSEKYKTLSERYCKKIKTPYGEFESLTIAAKNINKSRGFISYKLRTNPIEYYYI